MQKNLLKMAIAAVRDYHHYTDVGAPSISLEQRFSQVKQVIATTSMSDILYHGRTIFLFTASDLKTIVVPSTVFGVLGSYAHFTQDPGRSGQAALLRIPLVFIWTWLNLLPFNISNQRQSTAVEEDRANKPWRPLPAGRLTPRRATLLMMTFYPVALAASLYLHGLRSCLALMALGCWYNDHKGAENCGTRNFINAAGYLSFIYGAVEVALDSHVRLNQTACHWFLLIGMIIFSTIHIQDIPDQEGDHARGRKTLPLVIGDIPARWSIAILLPIWSLLAPAFWHLDAVAYLLPLTLSVVISARIICKCAVADDKLSFKIWNAWIMAIYALPVIRTFGL